MEPNTRREFIRIGAAGVALLAASPAWATPALDQPNLALIARARAALTTHGGRLAYTDRVGLADFSLPSRKARFFIIDVAGSRITSHLVAHGRGSDPSHTGWVQGFSNEPGSNASSIGAYVTHDIYFGAHGRSMRLTGLDPSNSNADARAIVVHAASYVSPDIVSRTGKLGRSQGCFAFTEQSLDEVLDRLGPGRLLFAGKT